MEAADHLHHAADMTQILVRGVDVNAFFRDAGLPMLAPFEAVTTCHLVEVFIANDFYQLLRSALLAGLPLSQLSGRVIKPLRYGRGLEFREEPRQPDSRFIDATQHGHARGCIMNAIARGEGLDTAF